MNIDFDTLQIVATCIHLTTLSMNGIFDIKKATKENCHSAIYYDKTKVNKNGTYQILKSYGWYFEPLVTYYGDDNYSIGVVPSNKNAIVLSFPNTDIHIGIENGIWEVIY